MNGELEIGRRRISRNKGHNTALDSLITEDGIDCTVLRAGEEVGQSGI